MKRASIIYLAMMMVLLATVAFVSSCTKEGATPDDNQKTNKTGCLPESFELIAGQNTLIGSVSVTSDATNLYVTYTANSGTFGELHLWVGKSWATLPTTSNTQENLKHGEFPYIYNALEKSTYTFEIPLAEIDGDGVDCGQLVYIVAHAEYGTETAYGGDQLGDDEGRWWRFLQYQICCIPNIPKCYQNETAWSAGTRYVQKGNWATYTCIDPLPTTAIKLYAGQHNEAGTVSFVKNGQEVTMTITLNTTYRFNQESLENVKIQGYSSTPPASNPAPGQFTTHKGYYTDNTVTITVPYFKYYGIHLDVQKEVACPEL